MRAVIVPPAEWYWQSCDCLLETGWHFLTTAEEKRNCSCNSDQRKPAKLHRTGLNDLLTPDTRKLDFSPIGSGTVKTARELPKSPDDPASVCRALFYVLENSSRGCLLPPIIKCRKKRLNSCLTCWFTDGHFYPDYLK